LTADNHVSGFVTIAGRPNVGKSTLLNLMIGKKIAIVSDKPQTTRNRITGILTRPGSQIIFLDTPGIHKPQHLLGENMVRVAFSAWLDVDCILFLVDGAAGIGGGDRFIAERLAQTETPVILAVNKVDALERDKVEAVLEEAASLGKFHAVFPISALTGYNVAPLLETITALLPPGPLYYPEGQTSERPENFIIAELVREQILHLTSEEIPHAIAIETMRIEPRAGRDDLIDVEVNIYVERESQKAIIIGKGGSMLKAVGTGARREIEALLGCQVFLSLRVKVKPGWRDHGAFIKQMIYKHDD